MTMKPWLNAGSLSQTSLFSAIQMIAGTQDYVEDHFSVLLVTTARIFVAECSLDGEKAPKAVRAIALRYSPSRGDCRRPLLR